MNNALRFTIALLLAFQLGSGGMVLHAHAAGSHQEGEAQAFQGGVRTPKGCSCTCASCHEPEVVAELMAGRIARENQTGPVAAKPAYRHAHDGCLASVPDTTPHEDAQDLTLDAHSPEITPRADAIFLSALFSRIVVWAQPRAHWPPGPARPVVQSAPAYIKLCRILV